MTRPLIVAAVLSFLALTASAQPIQVMNVSVRTADESMAGTDNDVFIVLGAAKFGGKLAQLEFELDTDDHDDFETGSAKTYRVTGDLPDDICEIKMIAVRKSTDDTDGGWKLGGLKLFVNDDPAQVIYSNESIDTWLEDGHLNWSPSNFAAKSCPPEPPLGFTAPPPSPTGCFIGTGEFNSDTDCDGVVDTLDADPGTPGADSDGDLIPDEKEILLGLDPNDPDSDDDGALDGFEDQNWNGQVDQGEIDPKNPDTDGDGWNDGPTNVRTHLVLDRVHCLEDEEDWGVDEVYVIVDDVRFPTDIESLDGTYNLDEKQEALAMVEVASRARNRDQSPDYKAALKLREDDLVDPTDDIWVESELAFGETGPIVYAYEDLHWYDDTRYELSFFTWTETFWDPDPANNADADQDGIDDDKEFAISSGEKMRGLADPGQREIFLELDWQKGSGPEEYSKTDVVSQFYYHGVPIHLDDGKYGGGGQLLDEESAEIFLWSDHGTPNVESLFTDPAFFATDRQGIFHYAVGADSVGNDLLGQASGPDLRDDGTIIGGTKVGMQVFTSDFLDHVSDTESILLMHELGHTLGLGHRPGDDAGTPEVVKPGRCTTSTPVDQCDGNVSHYWIESDSDTAMGSGFKYSGGWGAFCGVVGGIVGAFVGGPAGAVGGAIGGAMLCGWGVPAIEAGDREINFEDAEWNALELRGIRRF